MEHWTSDSRTSFRGQRQGGGGLNTLVMMGGDGSSGLVMTIESLGMESGGERGRRRDLDSRHEFERWWGE